jgi:putative flippase GtrA
MRRLLDRYAALIGQFLRFGVVGTVGFLVDAGVLIAAIGLGAGPYAGRVLSYLVAATATFALNRFWTFRGVPAGLRLSSQWGRFLALNLLGFALNYGTYAALVATVPLVAAYPVLGVAAGSLAGMVSNFVLSRRYVFRAA